MPGNELKEMESGTTNGNHNEQLRNMLTNTMSISPEMFEQVYLNPKNQVKGDLRKTFANPTPLGILGFAVGLFPLSIEFMGWRGSGGFAVATTTCTIFYGGVLLTIAGFGEFILGNTFPMLVFFGYGAHFFTFATAFMPYYDALGFYSGGDPLKVTPEFAASFGFYPISLSMLSLVFLVCSFRTNLVFVLIFVAATIGFSFASAALWYTAEGSAAYGGQMLVATGACFFAADILGWYLLASIMFQIMELPIPNLPVFDLSTVIKAKKPKAE